MKSLLLFISFIILPWQTDYNLKKLPADLKGLQVTPFFQPDEILRIWRFPEGGALFEELIEITRTGEDWTLIRYTYLLDEYRKDKELQKYRKKQQLNQPELIAALPGFINKRLLHRDVNGDNFFDDGMPHFCVCDLYRAEYRQGNQLNIFEFDLEEKKNTNQSKLRLMKFLKQLVDDE